MMLNKWFMFLFLIDCFIVLFSLRKVWMDYLIALLDWIPAYLVLVKQLQKSVIIYR